MANLQELIPAIFTGPGGQRLTPEQIAQRQQIAQSLIGRATDTRPDAGGWASVLTKGLLGFQSGAGERAADNAIAQNAATSEANIASMLGGLTGGSGFPTAVAGGASPTGAVATGTPVAIPSAPEIREGLINRGLQPHIADAFILNFQDESGLNPGINEAKPLVPGSRGGYGLYQLTGPRRREYEAFASQRGVPLDSTDAQLDFLMSELQGSEAGAAKSILSAPDTSTAAQAIVNNFLRPAPEHRQARSAKYGRVATTPQEAIAQVSPQGGGPVEPSPQFGDRWSAGFLPNGGQLRPFNPGEQINNTDGSYSTELSTTWELPDGQFVNVPSLWMGENGPVRFNPEDEQGIIGAMQQYEFGKGLSFPRFMSAQEAEAAAQQRSNAGGAGSVANPTPSPTFAGALVPQQPPSASPELLAQNDMMLGGALSPSGSSPVAQALSGYFPEAPSMQNPQSGGGINPSVIAALSNPYASQQERQIAGMLLGQQMEQAQAQQQQAQQMAQRQATAQTLGINPALAGDADAWKAAIDQATRNRNTVTVGNTVYDANTGQPVIQGPQERFTTITGPQAQQLGLDPNKAYNVGPDGKVSPIGENGVTVNVGGGEKFGEKLAELDAKAIGDLDVAGRQATRNLNRINQLEELLNASPSGIDAAWRQRAGEWGIKTDGLDTLQAAQAAINSLVPEQRQPGSGPMSDADLELFKQSLPRTINQPGGNALIIATMKGIAKYDAEGSQIIQRLRAGHLTREQAFDALNNRVNPMDDFKKALAGNNKDTTTNNGIKIRKIR